VECQNIVSIEGEIYNFSPSWTKGGHFKCDFTLVTTSDREGKSYRDEIPCTAWRAMAERMCVLQAEGGFHGVDGRLKSYRGKLHVEVVGTYVVRALQPPAPRTDDGEVCLWMDG
jgi:hypothetical protein